MQMHLKIYITEKKTYQIQLVKTQTKRNRNIRNVLYLLTGIYLQFKKLSALLLSI